MSVTREEIETRKKEIFNLGYTRGSVHAVFGAERKALDWCLVLIDERDRLKSQLEALQATNKFLGQIIDAELGQGYIQDCMEET